MARVARTRGPEKLSFVRNPALGSLLAAPAGGRAEAEFDFINDSPEVAAFELAVDGLSPDWLGGVGPQSGAMAAASGGGTLRLLVAPPLTASVGQYDFSVRILCGGDAIAPATPLVLQVEPAAEASPLAATPTAPPLPPEPVTGAAMVFAPEPVPEPFAPAAEAGQAERPPAPRRRPVVSKTPPAEAPTVEAPATEAPAAEGRAIEPPPQPDPVFIAPPPVSAAPPTPRANVVPPAPAPVPRPRPAAPPPEEEAVLVEHQAAPARALPAEEEEAPPEVEAALVDLADGGAVALRPGETRLLRFTFTNEAARETTYVLDEDQSLPGDWLTLVQDQVNLMRNGRGDVSLRLSPPLNAEPGDYPFSVTLGPQGGMLTPRTLTLTVQATPAVKLTSKEKAVRIGPMASSADFHLTVESAGNADTAFRVAVMPSQAAVGGEARDAKPVYDTPQWQYLFDKELETLRAPASRQPPRPVPIRLRLQRKGPWWFGFRETHQVRVAAVPVTDGANGGKPVNTVEVTATRLRFWPMPYLTLVPLLLMLLLLGSSGAGDLTVPDGKYQYHDGETNVYWVATPGPKKDVSLEWDAPRTALLRLGGSLGTNPVFSRTTLGGGEYAGQITMNSSDPSLDYNYQISRLVGGGDRSVAVRFVQTSLVTPLGVKDTTGTPRALPGTEVTLLVPVGKIAKLTLKNEARASNALNWWLVKPLGPSASFKVLYSKNAGSLQQHQAIDYPIVGAGAVGDTDQLVFVTTDAAKPVLTVKLKLVSR